MNAAIKAAILACVFSCAAREAAAGTWTNRHVTIPRPPQAPASMEWEPWRVNLVYDSWRGVTVALGGGPLSNMAKLAVAEYNGVNWVNLSDAIPNPPTNRHSFIAAFDSWRGVTVVFGGVPILASEPSNELWEYNGASWTKRTWTGSGPLPSSITKLCFDSVRGRTICLTTSPDPAAWQSWEWTGTVWLRGTDLEGVSASATEMVFDEGRNRAFIYTASQTTLLEQTWEYYPRPTVAGAWQQVPINDTPTVVTYNTSLVYDPHRQLILRTGGRQGGATTAYVGSTHSWDPANSKWTLIGSLPNETKLAGAGICYDRRRAVTVLFGGYDLYIDFQGAARSRYHLDTWEFSNPSPGESWLDFGYAGTEAGSAQQPWNTMTEALAFTPASGVIWLKGTNTPATLNTAALRTTPVTLRAWDGPVTIGR